MVRAGTFFSLAFAGFLAVADAQNATFQFNGTLMSGMDSMNGTFGTTGPRNVRYDTGLYGPQVEEVHYCMFQILPVSYHCIIANCCDRL